MRQSTEQYEYECAVKYLIVLEGQTECIVHRFEYRQGVCNKRETDKI
jgi:hypothetical protein